MSRVASGAITLYDISDGSDGGYPTFERQFTPYPGLLSEIGDPDNPVSGVDWYAEAYDDGTIHIGIAFWIAERYTIAGVTSSWQIYPVRVKEIGIPFVSYSITRYSPGAPLLTDVQWVDDTIEAVEAFTNNNYATQMEFGYGTVVVINYVIQGQLAVAIANTSTTITLVDASSFASSGRVLISNVEFEYSSKSGNSLILTEAAGVSINSLTIVKQYSKVAGKYTTAGWIAPGQIIDGDLFVDGTIAAEKIQANAIQATHLSADAITAKILKAGKTSTTDVANSGYFFNDNGTFILGKGAGDSISFDGNQLEIKGAGAGASEWSSSTTYTPGVQVFVNGNIYLCSTTNVNQTPPNASYWTPLIGTANSNASDRLDISSDHISVFSGGIERVRIGNLL
jgi:hypothetical protein